MNEPTERFAPEFSVIVPTLDEAAEIDETLRRARAALDDACEIIVVDGGSRDDTIQIARRHGRVLESPAGRGTQLGRGADEAEGDILVFLHADTWLPPGSAEAIRLATAAEIEAGCLAFALRPPSHDIRYRLLERGVNWRTRRFRTATGDQAIFATRRAYSAAGGFRSIPLFEDVTFVRAVRAVARFEALELTARTSRRRWERRGFFRTLLLHCVLRLAYATGVDPHALDRVYQRGR